MGEFPIRMFVPSPDVSLDGFWVQCCVPGSRGLRYGPCMNPGDPGDSGVSYFWYGCSFGVRVRPCTFACGAWHVASSKGFARLSHSACSLLTGTLCAMVWGGAAGSHPMPPLFFLVALVCACAGGDCFDSALGSVRWALTELNPSSSRSSLVRPLFAGGLGGSGAVSTLFGAHFAGRFGLHVHRGRSFDPCQGMRQALRGGCGHRHNSSLSAVTDANIACKEFGLARHTPHALRCPFCVGLAHF